LTEPIRVRWIPYKKLPPNSKLVTRKTRWGNKYKMIKHGGKYSREECLKRFDKDLDRILLRNPHHLDELFGYNLACSCMTAGELKMKDYKHSYPHCHADIYLDKIKEIRKRRLRSG